MTDYHNFHVTAVATTIFDMPSLDPLIEAAEAFAGRTRIIIIPDRKTDHRLFERVNRLKANIDGKHVRLECPSIDQQDTFLAKVGAPADMIPYDSDNRRNVGFLLAMTERHDMLISLDDDNFVEPSASFFEEHAIVCAPPHHAPVTQSSTGWINICDMLDYPPGQHLHPRGFPYHQRHTTPTLTTTQSDATVHLNAGLWLRDPDVDAVSRLAGMVSITGQKRPSTVLAANTWTPINTQNTAINGQAIPAYYYIRMGDRFGGLPIDRYGDILSGYFVQACIRSLGYAVRVGSPLVTHVRNQHDLLKDLTHELGGILLMEHLAQWLTDLRLNGPTYLDAFAELADALDDQSHRLTGMIKDIGGAAFMAVTAQRMRQWLAICRTILG